MINHDLKFIFMHIPKNAGTSLEKSLAKIQGTEDVSGMLQNKRDLLIYQTTNANPNYLFILFSRNPYDRLVSVYRHSMRKRRRFPKLSFSEYCIALCDYFIDKKDDGWLSTFDKRHARPQYFFIPINKKLLNKNLTIQPNNLFIGKFENLENDFNELMLKFNRSDIVLPHHKWGSGGSSDYNTYYDEESIYCVNELYEKDFEIFKYERRIHTDRI